MSSTTRRSLLNFCALAKRLTSYANETNVLHKYTKNHLPIINSNSFFRHQSFSEDSPTKVPSKVKRRRISSSDEESPTKRYGILIEWLSSLI